MAKKPGSVLSDISRDTDQTNMAGKHCDVYSSSPAQQKHRNHHLSRRKALGHLTSGVVITTAGIWPQLPAAALTATFSAQSDGTDKTNGFRAPVKTDAWGNPLTVPDTLNETARIPTPRLKPSRRGPVTGNWTQLADMPFPVQEIYPTPFWNRRIRPQGLSRRLRAQRFNIIVSAGGITGASRRGFSATDEVVYYDPISDNWDYGRRFPEPVHHLHLVAHNGFLYGLGGFAIETHNRRDYRWIMRRRVFRIDDVKGRWQETAPLPSPQAEAACASLNGFIHVAGGRSPSGSLNGQWSDHIDTDRHWAFDPRTNQWAPRQPLSVARNSAAAISVGGVFYVFGGRTVSGRNLATVEAYDPLSDRWQIMRPMPQALSGLAATAINRTIFVFGGERTADRGGSRTSVYDRVWAYDIREDRWRTADSMPFPCHGLGAATLNNAIYVFGGARQPGGYGTSQQTNRYMITR